MTNRCRLEGQRLAFYKPGLDSEFWERLWHDRISDSLYEGAGQGKLGPHFERPFTRHLPKQGHILEAGCGLGQFVLALRSRGYDAEGIDNAADTIEAVTKRLPDLPLFVGDATAIARPDSYYAGYISLGVVEHRRAGPEPFIAEAFRVLRPGGVALFSVPWFNSLRQLKARLGLYEHSPDGNFYQFAFAADDFEELLRQAGFQPVERIPFDPAKGLKDEIAPLAFLLKSPALGKLTSRFVDRLIRTCPKLTALASHMCLFVVQKSA